MNQPSIQTRALATEILYRLCTESVSLDHLFASHLKAVTGTREKAFVSDLCFGVMRWYPRLDFYLQQLLDKPIRQKNLKLRLLCWVGLYQIACQRTADHGAVSATVNACDALSLQWAKAMVNAILRHFIRRRETIQQAADDNEVARYAHPAWLLQAIKTDWPDGWQAILEGNNQAPPMSLRINARCTTRDDYARLLQEKSIEYREISACPQALILESAYDTGELPGFNEGLVSVQDGAAQLAAAFLQAAPGHRVLDACAAPGGKTCHILEREPRLHSLLAVDIKNARLHKLRDNLERLGLEAVIKAADVTQPDTWWDGEPFDRILVDAPCSATGVIRRHPDIKMLRQPADIDVIRTVQMNILDSLWPLLASDGKLLYVTCSIMRRENDEIIGNFLDQDHNAELDLIDQCPGTRTQYGCQIFPGQQDLDGFYFARLKKIR